MNTPPTPPPSPFGGAPSSLPPSGTIGRLVDANESMSSTIESLPIGWLPEINRFFACLALGVGILLTAAAVAEVWSKTAGLFYAGIVLTFIACARFGESKA